MSKRARKDFKDSVLQDKIFELIDAIRMKDTVGREEHLGGDLNGWMSRRISDKDRLVYRMVPRDGKIVLEIKDCKGHYGD